MPAASAAFLAVAAGLVTLLSFQALFFAHATLVPAIQSHALLVQPKNAASMDIVVKNLKLFVEGKEFVIKGMCYNPVPLGMQSVDSYGYEGAGLCSPKKTAYGEWKSACFDSDFFDGSMDDPSRWPPSPPNGWFKSVWERDFPLLQELGVNTLRLYNANPTTRKASEEFLGSNGTIELEGINNAGISDALGKDHTAFMDFASQYGFKVIFPLVGDYNLMTNTPIETYHRMLMNLIEEVGGHPALLMWSFGNELPLYEDSTLRSQLNVHIQFIRNYTKSFWNREVPITTSVVDNPFSYETLAASLDVDIFTANAGYRGLDFQDLWSGTPSNGFSGWKALSCQYNKPLFIGEMGWLSGNHSVNAAIPGLENFTLSSDVTDWFNQQWKDLVEHIDDGCIGGAVFEYSDEPLKQDFMQQTLGVVRFEPAYLSPNESSLVQNVLIPDEAVKNDFIFDAVKQGTFDGIAYNFNTDVFELIGRPAATLESVEDICNLNEVPQPSSSVATKMQLCWISVIALIIVSLY